MNINNEFLANYIPYSPEKLEPILQNRFNRLTLVDKHFTHRVTVDYNVAFNNFTCEDLPEMEMEDVAIVEIKTNRTAEKNGVHFALKQMGIYPNGFSKYCIGRLLTEPEIEKSNTLKPKMRRINKIIGDCI